MSKFLDGPAAGVVLMLRRAPCALRVVQSPHGTWDALDQLNDAPETDERIVVYRMVGGFHRFHACVRGKKKGTSGFYESASYEVCPVQPLDEECRDARRWEAWCRENETMIRAKSLKDESSPEGAA